MRKEDHGSDGACVTRHVRSHVNEIASLVDEVLMSLQGRDSPKPIANAMQVEKGGIFNTSIGPNSSDTRETSRQIESCCETRVDQLTMKKTLAIIKKHAQAVVPLCIIIVPIDFAPGVDC